MKELYQALAGAMSQEQRLTQISHNLANVNTPGYRQDHAVFNDFFAQAVSAQAASAQTNAAPDQTVPLAPAANPAQANSAQTNLGQPNPASQHASWPLLTGSYIDTRPGGLEMTGRALDVAIEGDGLFPVSLEGQSGQFYTRAGNFLLNNDHELVTPSGARILDRGGKPIILDLTQGNPVIGHDGIIKIGVNTVGELGVVKFPDASKLLKYGEGLMQAPQGVQPTPVEFPTLRPGALEGSNVNPIQSMIEMIETERAFQSHEKLMQTLDELVSQRIAAAR